MTRLELIQEDIARYGANPAARATHNGRCVYRADDGRMCAIGHRARPEVLPDLHAAPLSIRSFCTHYKRTPNDILRPEYQDAPSDLPPGERMAFWQALQAMHDDPTCWSSDPAIARRSRGKIFRGQDREFLTQAEGLGLLTPS